MADLKAIAYGVNSKTGDYLSPAERKAIFRKGKMGTKINKQSFRYGTASGKNTGGGGGGGLVKYTGPEQNDPGQLVKQDEEQQTEFENDEVKNLFQEIRSTFYEVHRVKKEKKNLHSKFLDLLGRPKKTAIPEEESVPTKKRKTRIGKKVTGAATGLFGGIFGILGDLLQFAILDWISKPENKKTVETFVKIFQGIFKFLDWWITTAVDNLLSGFAELVGGDSIIERIGGFFKLVSGFFMFRWLLNPFKMIKDLRNVNRVLKRFVKIFKNIFKLGDGALKKSLGGVLKLASKAFKVALGKTIKRFLVKVFGKAFTKGALALGKMLLKRAVGLVRRFPLIGPVIAFGLELAMGEPPGRAAFKAIGATLLGGLGGVIGSIVPGAGTIIGAVIGGLAGEWAGGAMYDLFFKGKEGDKKKEETPGMSSGGVASGPKDGYLVMLHGTEVVIPIDRIGEILASPFTQLGAGIIGGMMAVINSIGPAANFVKPLLVSFLGSTLTDFGIIKFTKTDTVGKTQGSSETLSRHIESERNKQDLDKLFGKDLLKDLGSMLMITGGSIFNSILGGGAKAKTRDQSSRYLTGDDRDNGQPGAPPSGRPTPGNTSTAAGQWKPLLELIAAHESVGGSYDSIYPSRTKPGLSNMTIAEADAWQASTASSRGSAAAGRYQFMHIKKQAADAGIGPNEIFSPENQDKMAISLLTKKRKITLDMIKNNPDEAMIRLGMEWAAMPMPKRMQGHNRMVNAGQSYYAGDGKNAAGVSVATVKGVLAKVAGGQSQQQSTQSTPSQALTPQQPAPLTQDQKFKMFQKAGMSALSSRVSSSSSSSDVTEKSSGFTAPSPPPASLTLPSPSSATLVPMSTQLTIDENLRSSTTGSGMNIISNFNNYNAHMNVQRMELNRTTISSSILNNRI